MLPDPSYQLRRDSGVKGTPGLVCEDIYGGSSGHWLSSGVGRACIASSMDPDLRRDDNMDPDLRRDDYMDPVLRRDDYMDPVLRRDDYMAPDLRRDDYMDPDLRRDDCMDPDLRRDDYMDPDLRRDDYMDPDLRRDDYWIPSFGGMTRPSLRNPVLHRHQPRAGSASRALFPGHVGVERLLLIRRQDISDFRELRVVDFRCAVLCLLLRRLYGSCVFGVDRLHAGLL